MTLGLEIFKFFTAFHNYYYTNKAEVLMLTQTPSVGATVPKPRNLSVDGNRAL